MDYINIKSNIYNKSFDMVSDDVIMYDDMKDKINYTHVYKANLYKVLKYLDPTGTGYTNWEWDGNDALHIGDGNNCCCAHDIEYLMIVKNRTTGCRIGVGQSCYRKFIAKNKEEVKQANSAISDCIYKKKTGKVRIRCWKCKKTVKDHVVQRQIDMGFVPGQFQHMKCLKDEEMCFLCYKYQIICMCKDEDFTKYYYNQTLHEMKSMFIIKERNRLMLIEQKDREKRMLKIQKERKKRMLVDRENEKRRMILKRKEQEKKEIENALNWVFKYGKCEGHSVAFIMTRKGGKGYLKWLNQYTKSQILHNILTKAFRATDQQINDCI